MSNHEDKEFVESVHLYMAFARPSKGSKDNRCIRHVIKKNLIEDLDVFRAKLKAIGGRWRIHKTVNARCVETARKFLLKRLIDFPERASFVDTEWRTALLQKNCIFGQKMFMLDIDGISDEDLDSVDALIPTEKFLTIYRSPKGFHIITLPFDTRKVCEFDYVTLLRDGYHFVEEVIG